MWDYNRRQVCTTEFSKRRRSFKASISRMVKKKNLWSKRDTMRNASKSKIMWFFQAWERLILALHLQQKYCYQILSLADCSNKCYHNHLPAGQVTLSSQQPECVNTMVSLRSVSGRLYSLYSTRWKSLGQPKVIFKFEVIISSFLTL